MPQLKRSQVERLFSYYHYLVQHHDGDDSDTISSAQLAAFLEIDATQVRKDLAAAGIRGCPRVGYEAERVVRMIRTLLGLGHGCKAVIVGAGRLGGAIAEYQGFSLYGLDFVAFFDSDPAKRVHPIGGRKVYPMNKLRQVVGRHDVKLGVITVPAQAAQEVATQLVEAGVRAIWNFAHTQLTVPRDVHVRHEHIGTGLGELAYHLRVGSRRR